MGVVNRYSSSVRNPASTTQDRLPVEESFGHLHHCIGTMETVIGDSANSLYLLCSVSSNARFVPDLSAIFTDANANLTGAKIGTLADDDCLMAATSLAAGGKFATWAPNIDAYNDPLWQLQAGVAADPMGKIDIYLKLGGADLAAATTITHRLVFAAAL